MSRTLSGRQAVLLGVVVLVGLGLIGIAVFAVGSRQWFWNDALEVRAGFPSVQGVEVGTRVRIRGMDAGEVIGLEAPASAEGQVVLRLRVQGKFRHLVRQNATVQIVSLGMLGAKAVELLPGSEDQPLAAEGAVLASKPSTELTDVLGDVKTTLKDVVDGKGTLGKLAKDPEAYNELVTLIRGAQTTVGSIQRSADAIERVPVLGGYVENPKKVLVRPRHAPNRKWFPEAQLFEPGRAVLTSGGRSRLDGLSDWFEMHKHLGADVVVVAYADPPRERDAAHAKRVTEEQSQAVVDYLKSEHKVHKRGWIPWYHRVKVTALGMGVNPPPEPDKQMPPFPCVGIYVFVPQN